MAQLVEINQIGKREDLRDFITITDMKNKPFLALVPKVSKPVNMLMSWQADAYDALKTTGIADGVDVSTFENSAKDRALVSNHCQKWRRTAMVGDLAENVSNVAGAKSGELARAIEKKLEELSRDIEATLCSSQEAQLETNSTTPYMTRGLGAWIIATPTGLGLTQIPVVARTPSLSIEAAPITEALLRPVLASMFAQYGRRDTLTMLCGTTVKQRISDFTQTVTVAANTFSSMRSFNQDVQSGKVTHNVTVYEGDFNTVELHPSLLLGATDGGTVGNADTAYILPMDMYGLAFHRQPRIQRLEDQGGGPRALVDAVAGLIAKNPISSGKLT